MHSEVVAHGAPFATVIDSHRPEAQTPLSVHGLPSSHGVPSGAALPRHAPSVHVPSWTQPPPLHAVPSSAGATPQTAMVHTAMPQSASGHRQPQVPQLRGSLAICVQRPKQQDEPRGHSSSSLQAVTSTPALPTLVEIPQRRSLPQTPEQHWLSSSHEAVLPAG